MASIISEYEEHKLNDLFSMKITYSFESLKVMMRQLLETQKSHQFEISQLKLQKIINNSTPTP